MKRTSHNKHLALLIDLRKSRQVNQGLFLSVLFTSCLASHSSASVSSMPWKHGLCDATFPRTLTNTRSGIWWPPPTLSTSCFSWSHWTPSAWACRYGCKELLFSCGMVVAVAGTMKFWDKPACWRKAETQDSSTCPLILPWRCLASHALKTCTHDATFISSQLRAPSLSCLSALKLKWCIFHFSLTRALLIASHFSWNCDTDDVIKDCYLPSVLLVTFDIFHS